MKELTVFSRSQLAVRYLQIFHWGSVCTAVALESRRRSGLRTAAHLGNSQNFRYGNILNILSTEFDRNLFRGFLKRKNIL